MVHKQCSAVEIVDKLATIEKPNTKDISINTLTIIESIDNLEFEREDGELDVGIDEAGSWDENELRIATEIIDNIKMILEDVENGNWYKRSVSSLELAYSRLQGEDYQYKIIKKSIEPTTLEEAEMQAAEIKANISKIHPDDPSFTLEDIRVRDFIVDSNNNVIDLRVQPTTLTN